MAEDKGIVPDRVVHSIPDMGDRELLSPMDLDFERQEKIERLMEKRDEAATTEDGAEARKLTHDLLNLIFVEPFTEDEFKKLKVLVVVDWIADFFESFETSSEQAATRAVQMQNRAQRRAKSAQRSKSTSKPATR